MKRFIKIFSIAALIIATGLISFTAAKYVAKQNNGSSADVAEWSFSVSDTDIATSSNFSFAVFETILDTDGSEETDVAEGTITSGTSGNFDVEITNTSEVTAEYIITFSGITSVSYSADDDSDDSSSDDTDGSVTETNGITVYDGELYVGSFVNYYSFTEDDLGDISIPIEYSSDGVNYTSDISELSFTGTLGAGDSTTDVTIYWRWPIDCDSETDLQLGILAAEGYDIELVVTASVAAWQIN